MIEAPDGLLNHWDIVHFHLGESLKKGGHVKRTGSLLFARATLSDIYFLDVLPHGKDNFADRELVNIAIRNWPETFEPFRLIDLGLDRRPIRKPSSSRAFVPAPMTSNTRAVMMHRAPPVSAQRTSEQRAQGLNATFAAENGAHYYPPGGGYSCAGTSLLAQAHGDLEICWAGQLASIVAAEIEQIAATIARARESVEAPELKFGLRTLDEMKNGHVFERQTRTMVRLPIHFDRDYDPRLMLTCLAAGAMA